jgi:hypothetical protein
MGFTDGTITTTASEANLFDITGDNHFATWLFLNAMTSTETFVIKVYVKDQNGATMRLAENETLTGAQDPPSLFIPFLPTKQYKVSIQRTAGTDRAIAWQRVEIPLA